MCPTTKTAPCNDACKLMQSNLKWNTTGEVEKSPCGKKPNFGKLQIHSLFIHPSTQRSSSCLSFSPLHFSFSPLGRWKWLLLLLLEKRGGGCVRILTPLRILFVCFCFSNRGCQQSNRHRQAIGWLTGRIV